MAHNLYAHISALGVRVQSQSDASNLPATQKGDRRTVRLDWLSISDALSLTHWASLLYRWHVAFRSFRAHIRIQSARAGGRVDLGPAFQLRDGRYQENTQTTARAEGIKRLLATHPWVDSVDLRIFLAGFDAGEEYCSTGHALDIRAAPQILEKTNQEDRCS